MIKKTRGGEARGLQGWKCEVSRGEYSFEARSPRGTRGFSCVKCLINGEGLAEMDGGGLMKGTSSRRKAFEKRGEFQSAVM